jgi:hypothetical protein
VIAKQTFPYSAPSLRLGIARHLLEPVLILYSCKALLLLLAGYALYRWFVLGDSLVSIQRVKQALPSRLHPGDTVFSASPISLNDSSLAIDRNSVPS